ncbi:MAG TPA: DUF2934 domain-containing protein [Candidatus Paceibacterota bacterium]|nr:DUF2934 domain-containing protein [Candidatus Paceibacterota bacterium]
MKKQRPSHEEISARAYQIFVERGCPEGRDLEHWLEAEAQLSGESTANLPTSKASKPAARQTASRRA